MVMWLQSKDKLIASLKDGDGNFGAMEAGLSAVELEETKQERDLLREELQQSRMTVENLRTELQVRLVVVAMSLLVLMEELTHDRLLVNKL